MEYLKASFRGNNPRHIYRTQLDLQGLTPEQIIKIEPETIPEHILEEPYRKGANLTRQQKSAVLKLIAIKKIEKKIGNSIGRQDAINNFLRSQEVIQERPPVDQQIRDLMGEATKELLPVMLSQTDKEINAAINKNRNMNYDSRADHRFRHEFTEHEIMHLRTTNIKDPENFKRIFGYSLDELIGQNIGLRKDQFKGGKKTRKYRKYSKRRFNKKSSRKNKKKTTRKRKY